MKYIALLITILTALFPALFTSMLHSEVPATPSYTVIEDKAVLPILTPSLSERKTLKIRLSNGLQAYLVSDPNTDKSAAMLTVKVGSWEDPKGQAGIAHFLEHMLFLGTKKYPKESEYDRYLKEHDGESNAFTASDQTSYMFAVNNEGFTEALDRFSQFFKEPLFNPSGVSRELQAIDQEYAKNIENDDIRVLYVRKELGNPDHPFHAFNMGNSAALNTVSQEALKAFYHQHYSANLMYLLVYSTLPLEKLKDLVVTDFSGIPNQNKTPFSTNLNPLSPNLKGHILYVEPVKNVRTLSLIWTLPPKFARMKDTKPESVIGYVLGDEGKNSLLLQLKQEKLASALRCGKMKLGNDNNDYYIEIDLTDKGIHEVDTVLERCFQTLANLRQKGIPQYLFDEIHRMGVLNYQYLPRTDAFHDMMQHATWIVDEDLATYPEQTLITQKFDPAAIKETLDFMTPQNVQIIILAPPDVTGVKSDHKETWIGAPYAVKAIPPKKMEAWSRLTPHPQIDLPPPNLFIPQTLQLVNKGQGKKNNEKLYPHPKTLIDDGKGKIYFSQDTRYRVPRIYWYFEVKTPAIEEGQADKMVLADLYSSALKESLNEFVYPASLAELNFTVDLKENGIAITIEGFSANAPLLFQEITKRLKSPEISEQRFKVHKETLLRQYQNFYKEMPLKQADEILRKVIYKNLTAEREKAVALRKVSFDKFKEYTSGIFQKNYVEGLMYGNMLEKEALDIANKLFDALGGTSYPPAEQQKKMVIVLPAQEGPFYLESKTKSQGNVGILAIEDDTFSFKERAAQQILMQAMSEPFFGTLRTKQQTGYIVDASGQEVEKHLFNVFLVQSNTHDPRDLVARFELFIEGYLQEMARSELTEERFIIISSSLQKTLEQPRKNTREMGDLLQTLAFKYGGDFDWMDKRIQGFKELKYIEFLQITQRMMGKSNKKRIAIMLKGIIPPEYTLDYQRLSNVNQLIKMSTYESSEVK